MKGAAKISQLRGHLNSAYSTAPPEVAEVFDAALDQVVDQHIKVTDVLLQLFSSGDIHAAEGATRNAVREAERAALRAARSYADNQYAAAQRDSAKLTSIPRDNASLIADKRPLDEDFLIATKLHETDDIAAFEKLLNIARQYRDWSTKVDVAVAGSQGLIRTEKRRLRLQLVTIVISVLALLLSIINAWRK